MKSVGQLLNLGLIGLLVWMGGHAQVDGQTSINTAHVCYQNEVTFTDTVYGEMNYPSDSAKFCSCILTPADGFNGTIRVTLVKSVRQVGADSCTSKLQISTPKKRYRLLCPYINSFFDLPLSSEQRITFQQSDGSMKFTFKVIKGDENMKLSCSGDPLPTSTTKNPTTESSVPTLKATTKSFFSTLKSTTKSSVPTLTTTTKSSVPTLKPTTKSSVPTVKQTTKSSVPTLKATTKSFVPTLKPTTKSSVPTVKPTAKNSVPTPKPTTKSSIPTLKPTTNSLVPTPKPSTKSSVTTLKPTTKIPDPTANPQSTKGTTTRQSTRTTTKRTTKNSTTGPIHNQTVSMETFEEFFAAVFKVCICQRLKEEYAEIIAREVDSKDVVSMDSYLESGSILLAKLLLARTQ